MLINISSATKGLFGFAYLTLTKTIEFDKHHGSHFHCFKINTLLLKGCFYINRQNKVKGLFEIV